MLIGVILHGVMVLLCVCTLQGAYTTQAHTQPHPQVIGGGLRDSFLVDGVAFKKTFSYAGFEQQPKSFKSERGDLPARMPS